MSRPGRESIVDMGPFLRTQSRIRKEKYWVDFRQQLQVKLTLNQAEFPHAMNRDAVCRTNARALVYKDKVMILRVLDQGLMCALPGQDGR